MEHVYSVNDTSFDQPDNGGEAVIVPRLSTSPEPLQDSAMESTEASRVIIKDGDVIQFQGLADVSDVCEEPSSQGDKAPATETLDECKTETKLASDASLTEEGIITPSRHSKDIQSPSSEKKPQGGGSVPVAGDTARANLSNSPSVSKVSNVSPLGFTSTVANYLQIGTVGILNDR